MFNFKIKVAGSYEYYCAQTDDGWPVEELLLNQDKQMEGNYQVPTLSKTASWSICSVADTILFKKLIKDEKIFFKPKK